MVGPRADMWPGLVSPEDCRRPTAQPLPPESMKGLVGEEKQREASPAHGLRQKQLGDTGAARAVPQGPGGPGFPSLKLASTGQGLP